MPKGAYLLRLRPWPCRRLRLGHGRRGGLLELALEAEGPARRMWTRPKLD